MPVKSRYFCISVWYTMVFSSFLQEKQLLWLHVCLPRGVILPDLFVSIIWSASNNTFQSQIWNKLNLQTVYHIYFIRWGFPLYRMSTNNYTSPMKFSCYMSFTFLNNPRDLDPSYKTDLDFWYCFARKKTPSYSRRNTVGPSGGSSTSWSTLFGL